MCYNLGEFGGTMKKIDLVVPCFNEEESIPLFYKEIKKIRKTLKAEVEIIFVDDGSTDKSLKEMKKIAEKDELVKYISFSRNFKKEAAMLAGLEASTGDYVTVMDVDLQDPPSLLEKMLYLVEEKGYDIVGTRRVTRKGEPPIRSFFARMFYKLINKMSNVEMVDGARDYRLMTRQVVDSILKLGEYNRYSKGLFAFVGFKTKWLEYENVERVAGETKWSFWKLFKYAIEGIVAFTTVPLTLAVAIGFIFCLVAFIMIIVIIVKTLAFGDPTSGWPSLACIIFLVSGVQLLCIGVIGEYLAKTYLEVKKRPIYIIKETNME